ncbi:MAG: MBL fold metallo-hydrolase [Planctomycetota bacterium]
MKLIFLGTGTSTGVPAIGCKCPVCSSSDPRDRRTRTALMVTGDDGKNIVIDTGPDFRTQCLATGLTRVDAVLYTHDHIDHIAGLDDMRRFNALMGVPIPIHATVSVLARIQTTFPWAFGTAFTHGEIPNLTQVEIKPGTPFTIGTTRIQPLSVDHGRDKVTAFRFGNCAYVTDCSAIGPETMAALAGLDLLVLGALREKPHPKHFTFAEAAAVISILKPDRAFFVHLGHDCRHADQARFVTPPALFAHDGLVLECD